MKPLEIKDFSGGQTDNYFQGEVTRAEKLDNLLVAIDHKLVSRNGSLVKPNAKKSARINSIKNFNSFTELVYSSEGHFYDENGVEIFGPSGNEAFVGATADAVYTSADLQGHLILACDEILQPQKIYRDEAGDLQVRNVGLPKVSRAKTSDADLLTACLAAANSLRTNFLAHINSAEHLDNERDGTGINYPIATQQPVTSTKAHWSVDRYALCYFQGVSFLPPPLAWQPNTIPTPAPAATDYTTLVNLIEALSLAFEEHRLDSAGFASIDAVSNFYSTGPNRYHALGYQTQFTDFITGNYPDGFGTYIGLAQFPTGAGIQQRVVVSPNPDNAVNAATDPAKIYRTKLIAIAEFLDDFAVKFCLHETAPMIHRYNSQNTLGNSLVAAAFNYQFLAPLLNEKPVIIPTPFNFIYASNYVQRAMKNHFLNTDFNSVTNATFPTMHTMRNDSIVSGLSAAGFFFANLPATPTIQEQYSAFAWDVILAKINIFASGYAYNIHTQDLQFGVEQSRVQLANFGGSAGAWTAKYANVGSGTDYNLGVPGQAVIATYGVKSSNQTPKKQSFEAIYSFIGAGYYGVVYSALAISGSNNLSLGTFMMHPYPLAAGATFFPGFAASTQDLKTFGYAPDIYDLASWIPVIEDFYDAFKAHLAAPNVHYFTETASVEFSPATSLGVPAGGVQYFPLSSLLPTQDLPGAQPLFILPEIKSYAYAFTYSDNFTDEFGVSYRVESQPVFTDAVNSEETLAVGVTSLMYGETAVYLTNQIITPVAMILGAEPLVNDATSNYADTLLNAYRTIGNGTSFFSITTLPATPLDLSMAGLNVIDLLGAYDLVSDVYSINGHIPLNDSEDILYTNGGVTSSTQPPKTKVLWQANGYVYYGGVYDGDTFLANRVLQSAQLAPDWVPGENSVDFDSPVVGGGSARNVNVCLTETGVYRLEGAFGLDKSGSIVKQQISNQIGGIAPGSVVVTEVGLFFAGTNGFYYTDGYQCIRISQELVTTYALATTSAAQKRCIQGTYDRTNRRVYWTLRSDPTQTDSDIISVFDINFGLTPSGTFTTLFGNEDSWNPSSIGTKDNVIYMGDEDGYLYFFDAATKTDPLKDTGSAPSTWIDTYIPWEYRSTIMDFGGTALRKLFSRIHHVGKNRGDVALQYYIIADNKVAQDLAPMRFIDDGAGVVDQWRRVGGQKIRADFYQVGVRNGRFTVYNSDTYGAVPNFISRVGTETTIEMIASPFPDDTQGMSLCFSSDAYQTEFLILSSTLVMGNQQLLLADPDNKAQGLISLQWEIRGFMKEQAFALDALTIWYDEQGNLGSQYRGYGSQQGGGGNTNGGSNA